MNRIRRITVMLAGSAATALVFGAVAPLPALAVHVPPPPADARQAGCAQVQQCPSAAGQPRIGKAWEHRRKFGGVGPAAGGW